MKILIIFADMLRPNRFIIYNDMVSPNGIDEFIKSLGGSLYDNCFTPAPDTPRSMASFYTGETPLNNGCDARVKWPEKFISKDTPTIFDPFINNKYKLNFFSNPNERRGGLFPPGIRSVGDHNNDYDLKKYLEKIHLDDNHLLFLSLPDYHWALQDWGYTKKGERVAINEIRLSFDIIFDKFSKDDFDHIFIFSDHGFKFNNQMRNEERFRFINRDRTNIFMLHRKRGDNNLNKNNKLCSIQDLLHTIYDIFGFEKNYSLFNDNQSQHIVIEDHYSISAPEVNQNVDIWGVATENNIYARTLEDGYLIMNDGQYEKKICEELDTILLKKTQFGEYFDEYNKVFSYHDLILAQTDFMNGNPRADANTRHRIMRYFQVIKDIIKDFLDNLRKSHTK